MIPIPQIPVDDAEEADITAAEVPPVEAPQLDLQAVEAPTPICVVELSGQQDGRATLVTTTEAIIGRGTRADGVTVSLPFDQWVSRQHARLYFQDGQWWIADHKSANGVWLDAPTRQIDDPVALPPEQVFRLGHTDLMLSADLRLANAPPDVI